MSARFFVAFCPGCSKRIHAPSEASQLKQMATHARNCNVLLRAGVNVKPVIEAPK